MTVPKSTLLSYLFCLLTPQNHSFGDLLWWIDIKSQVSLCTHPWWKLSPKTSIRFCKAPVTQPKLQRWPNQAKLRSMDSYIQILRGFQKCMQKGRFFSPFGEAKRVIFYYREEMAKELFAFIFGIQIKFRHLWFLNPSILTPSDLVYVAT